MSKQMHYRVTIEYKAQDFMMKYVWYLRGSYNPARPPERWECIDSGCAWTQRGACRKAERAKKRCLKARQSYTKTFDL